MKNQGITLIGQLLCVKFLSIMVRFKKNFSTKKVVTLSSITPLKNKFKNSAPLLADCSRVIPDLLGRTCIMATLSLWLASIFIVYLKPPWLRIVVRVAGSCIDRGMLVLGCLVRGQGEILNPAELYIRGYKYILLKKFTFRS